MFRLKDLYEQCDSLYEIERIQHFGDNITTVVFNTGDYMISFNFNQWLTPKRESILKLIHFDMVEPIQSHIIKK